METPAAAAKPLIGPLLPLTYRTREVRVMTVQEGTTTMRKTDSALLAARYWREVVEMSGQYDCEREIFVVLCLNQKNRVKAWSVVTTGTATACLAHPREVFRAAIMESACAIICLHNHPSGDPAPSAADMQITRLLREAGKTVAIELLDHVIVGTAEHDPMGRGFYSFREAGLL